MSKPVFDVPIAVIDTNVVFDWLVFADSPCGPLGEAVEMGSLRWLATRAMQEEFFHVLGRGSLDHWQPDLARLHAAWDEHCTFVEPVPLFFTRPRCSDPDDQMFIDLALGHRTRWLLSKDRAVLKLAGRMRAFGVEVATPAAWCRLTESPADGVSAGRAGAASFRPAGR